MTVLETGLKVVDFEITVISANNVPSYDVNGFSDPYAKVIAIKQDNAESVQKTKTKKMTLQPVWNEKLNFSDIIIEKSVIIEVWDKDVLKTDDFIGRCSLNIGDYLPKKGEDSKESADDFVLHCTKKGKNKEIDTTIKLKLIVKNVKNTELEVLN